MHCRRSKSQPILPRSSRTFASHARRFAKDARDFLLNLSRIAQPDSLGCSGRFTGPNANCTLVWFSRGIRLRGFQRPVRASHLTAGTKTITPPHAFRRGNPAC